MKATQIHVTNNEKGAANLKENKEGYRGGLEGRKRVRGNYIVIL